MIISGYPGIGKSTIAGKKNFIDLESSNFFNKDKRPDDWAVYYCNIANDLSRQGFTVFVSSHQAVRERLEKYSKEDCYVVIPDISLKYKWVNKLHDRYQASKSEKDFKAYLNSADHFDDNIEAIKNGNLPVVTIDNMDYRLEDIVNYINYVNSFEDLPYDENEEIEK